MKTTRREHPIYKEWEESNKSFIQLVGRWQYLYETDKGMISLVELVNYGFFGRDFWEIYCVKGDLFEDVERFSSKKEADKRICELLEQTN